MMVKAEQDDLKKSLISSIKAVCTEKLRDKTAQFSIEGLIAVTLEKDQVILVNINEALRPPPIVEASPRSGNVLCSVVSKSPLVVTPLQISNGSSPAVTTACLPVAQLAADVTKQPPTITLEAASNSTKKAAAELNGGTAPKHKTASLSETPPQKKRLLEEHLTSHLISDVSAAADSVSMLENVVVKQEVLSDDDDFAAAHMNGSLAQGCASQALVDLDQTDPLIEEASMAVNGVTSDLKKLVRSDKMWNQHPVAQLSVAQVAMVSPQACGSSGLVRSQRTQSLPGSTQAGYDFGSLIKEESEEDDEETSSYLNSASSLDSPPMSRDVEEAEFLKLARSILLYKGTFITVHSFCKVSRRTGKNAMLKISSERACWVMQKMNVPAWDEKYIGEYKELRKGTKVFFKCPPDMVNPKALAYYNVSLQTYRAGYYEECKSASFPTKTELLKRIFDASPY